jgi:tetratricopeptide (TPR) repeat protein/mono/diheme cytochrome c family protein
MNPRNFFAVASGFLCASALGVLLTLAAAPPASSPTFTRDIAPIVFANCAACHHPGGSGPFSLLGYEDVAKRAEQIAVVTASRFMPPWLPEPGYGEFLGERRLSDEQIQLIRRWATAGAPEGMAEDLPPVPAYHDGWQLGEPDLVLRLPRSWTLQASGPDVFRNFVVPIPVERTRYVGALEILPGNKQIVHHANVLVDRAQASRRRDAEDPEIGFYGMDVEMEFEDFEPESHFLFWKPGTSPWIEPPEMTWRLEPGTDLVLNMHLQPTGKLETLQPTLGLYFSETPPTKFPMLLQLENDAALDIPPGAKEFVVKDEFELPLEVEVLGVYPHAHYLGKEIQGYVTLPDGTRRWLIWIRDWDLNWQAVFRYKQPVRLPRGTKLTMRWTYDNSEANPRNPSHPPRRVRAGNQSTDEMAHLWIQLLPPRREDLRQLQAAVSRHRLSKVPDDFAAHTNLGSVLRAEGKIGEAIEHFRAAVAANPAAVPALNNLGGALLELGRAEEALPHLREAVRLRPEYSSARYNLALALALLHREGEAITHLREVLSLRPNDALAHYRLGSLLAGRSERSDAIGHLTRALELDPGIADAHYKLGRALALEGKLSDAIVQWERAVTLDPGHADAHNDLGTAYAMDRDFARAIAHFEAALRANPSLNEARVNLERARALVNR